MATIVTRSGKGSPLTNNEVDANFTNLNSDKIETDAEVRAAVEAATDSNVFTDADHTKLNSVEASADVTDTANVVAALTAGSNITIGNDGTIAGAAAYSLPAASANTLGGVKIGSGLSIDGSGVVSASGATNLASTTASTTIVITSSTGNNATIAAATTSAAGVMIAADKSKLDGIEASANVTDTANVVAALTAGTNVTIAANGTISSTDTNTTYSVGAGGLTQQNFTTTLKNKLDGITAGANFINNTNQLTNGAGFITSADGGNATTLDGIDSTSFLRSDQRDSGVGLDINGGTNNGANDATFYIGASNNNDWGLLINANSGKTEYGAKIDMPASYAYALQIRNNGTESFRVHDSGLTMTGNLTLGGTVDGRDVAADGTKLDTIATSANNYSFPYGISSSAGNSTVVQRSSSGYIFANYFNTTNGDIGTGIPNKFYVSTDDYIRHVDIASMKSLMNVTAKTGYLGRETYTSDANYWVGSMGHNNVSFDNLFLYGSGFTDNWSSPAGQPAGATHWQGVQSLHYSTGSISATYGFQMVVGQGNPALCYLRGRWASTSNGFVKMWNAGNDGSGSGLDADLLDGLDSGSFLRSDTADTASGDITFNGGAGAITIGADGDIRSSSNNWSGESHGKMQYHSNNWYIQYYGNVIHRDSGGTNRMTLDGSGNVTFASNVTAYSDIRLKENIKTIENAVDLVGQMRGVFYTEKKTKNARVGVIAQEIEKVLPEVVRDNEQYNPDTGKTEDSIKSVDYGNIVGVLVEAIKELKAEVEELKNGSNL